MKEVHSAIGKYAKVLDKRTKPILLPNDGNDPLALHPHLANRAIAMHLLREGQFGVASTFIAEANANPPRARPSPSPSVPQNSAGLDGSQQPVHQAEHKQQSWSQDFGDVEDAVMTDDEHDDGREADGNDLQGRFAELHHILHTLRNDHDLTPALAWARTHSETLEHRGSNLEFELCRLKFVELYTASYSNERDDTTAPLLALEYARTHLPPLPPRHLPLVSHLASTLAFYPSLSTCPYAHLFNSQSAYAECADSFTREFCGLLGLSEKSPLGTAVIAGGIALPVLEKLEQIRDKMFKKNNNGGGGGNDNNNRNKQGDGESAAGGEKGWTSTAEMPVPVPLPSSLTYHSIFVCPVSKEQATDANPPMLLPCGHVIAKESLERLSKRGGAGGGGGGGGGGRFKCAYCPGEGRVEDCKRVFL
ncbi:hypothetical protein LTR28_009449 [Elasticomyces elasticus]|nr:hypothetical protein LTR28_009449 [Elasticomyces elasticus]